MMRLIKTINTLPSLYLSAGAIHGCVLLKGSDLAYIEDVGRHNAVDKIAGWMRLIRFLARIRFSLYNWPANERNGNKNSSDADTYTGIAIRIYPPGVIMAYQTGLTLIGRARGKRFTALTGCNALLMTEGADWDRKRSGRTVIPTTGGITTMTENPSPLASNIVAVILAGGQARRMGGGDKTSSNLMESLSCNIFWIV